LYSLTRRLLTYVSLAFLLSFGVTAVALDTLFRDLAERSLRELLDAQMVALIAAADTDESGRVRGASTEAEARLRTPGSGLYAEIRAQPGGLLWRSPSVVGTFVTLAADLPAAQTAFRYRQLADGGRLAVAERGIKWEYSGRRQQKLVFAVATSMTPYEQQLRRFRTQLFGGMTVLTVLLLGTLALLLRWVMSPVRRLEAEISAVESGQLEALGTGFPRELAGVAVNLPALLAGERARISRYRDTLGNLAHSLKTPLAILRGALAPGSAPPATVEVATREIERMGGIIEHQLRRAATSGGRTIGQAPVELRPLLQELRLTLVKVHSHKDLSFLVDVAADVQILGDRADLLEALGNLLDNACKWCRSTVRITVTPMRSANDRAQVVIRIDDDGPGFPDSLRQHGPARGRRADETTPGHGIGLAMVQEMAELYDGTLQLGVSELGGARVELRLPGRGGD
jgi:two-component system sensor histidine kinase PhoQ